MRSAILVFPSYKLAIVEAIFGSHFLASSVAQYPSIFNFDNISSRKSESKEFHHSFTF
jgi:hypothetical protein